MLSNVMLTNVNQFQQMLTNYNKYEHLWTNKQILSNDN